MAIRGERQPVPAKMTEREAAAAVNSPVKTYTMSPEELEDYRAKTGYKAPTDQHGQQEKKPIELPVGQRIAAADEGRRAKGGRRATAAEPDKKAFLQAIASGKSISAIEREWKMKLNALHGWVKKWGYKGINPGKARELLKEMGETEATYEAQAPGAQAQKALVEEAPEASDQAAKAPEAAPAPTAAPIDISKILKERDDALVDLGNAREQIEKLKTQNTYAVALAGEAADKQQAEISQLKADKAELVRYLTTAKHDLEELLKERDMLLQTVEKAVDDRAVPPTGNDPVNHPAHYTAGSVECIDAIEAATTGLIGGRAYNTGAAIKYLWRWSRKGGAEDLRKARWYIDRLIADVEAPHDSQ